MSQLEHITLNNNNNQINSVNTSKEVDDEQLESEFGKDYSMIDLGGVEEPDLVKNNIKNLK